MTLALVWLLPNLVLAQTVVSGSVTDDSSRAIAGAIVGIQSLGVSATANERGMFVLMVERRGTFTVLTRALGYAPVTREVYLRGGDTVRIDFRMAQSAQQLEPVVVAVDEDPLPRGIMRDFEERRRMGFGRFITRDLLDEREHDSVADLLRGIAGVRMVRRPGSCGGGFAAASGRGLAAIELSPSASTSGATCGGGTPLPPACYMTIYLDGIRLWAPGSPDPPDLNQLRNTMYEGVEIYRGPSELPTRYSGTGSACGAVLLWTRVGDER